MARNGIQFQKGLSLPEFQKLYGTEDQCELALEKARWPDGFRCPHCHGEQHGLVYGRRLKRYQCRSCGHQATVTAGTILQATKLPLTTWFLAFYLIGQAKTGISSLELSRHLGVNYDCDDPGNPIISRSDSNYDRPGQLSAFLRDLSICIDGADQLRSVVT